MTSQPLNPIEVTPHITGPVPRFSLVVPTYNVAAYIDGFFESIFAQTSKTTRFEVIVVDDGSTDASGQIALDWAVKYPNQIRYIRQNNGGLSQARNTGLQAARGAWISFPDPDDFLDPDYFRFMLEQTVVPHDNPLLMIVSKLLPYFEDTDTSVDNHPLDYRFKDGLQYVDTSHMGDFIHLSAASCWFDRAMVVAHKLRFNPRVQSVFEDGHLVSKLLMMSPDRTIAVVPDAIYHYRKRADASSLVMGANAKPAFYLACLEYGYLDLLHFARAKLGHVPAFVQRACVYELQARLKHLLADPAHITVLTRKQQARFITLLDLVMAGIDADVIAAFQIGKFHNQMRLALMARLRYFTGADQTVDFSIMADGHPLVLHDHADHWHMIGDTPVLGEHWCYVQIPQSGQITLAADGAAVMLRHHKRNLEGPFTEPELRAFARGVPPKRMTAQQAALRAHLDGCDDTYRGAWLVMGDAQTPSADCMAVYDHLMTTGHADRVWCVLSVLSPDWAPLMAAGVRLLPHGSRAHAQALVQADALITSSMDHGAHWPMGAAILADLTQIATVILPQGGPIPKTAGDYLCLTDASDMATPVAPYWLHREMTVTGLLDAKGCAAIVTLLEGREKDATCEI